MYVTKWDGWAWNVDLVEMLFPLYYVLASQAFGLFRSALGMSLKNTCQCVHLFFLLTLPLTEFGQNGVF